MEKRLKVFSRDISAEWEIRLHGRIGTVEIPCRILYLIIFGIFKHPRFLYTEIVSETQEMQDHQRKGTGTVWKKLQVLP